MKTYAFDFTGRIALVTGASRGIGAAIARALAAHNATVILASRKIEGLREVEHEIASSGGAAYSIPCHTGDLTQIESLFQTIEERWGGIDLLVNNAATNPYFGEMLGVDEGVWDKTMAVNLKGYFFIALAADMVIYYRGEALYAYRIPHRAKERFTAETFPSPYQKYYSVQMRVHDSLLLVVAGIAGSYNGSIVDIDTRKVIIKNIAMASSRCYLNTHALYYCTGSAGQWQMVRFSIADKAKKIIATFTDIADIHFAAQGYILETSSGCWIAAYGQNMIRIPFPFEPAGVYKYRPILKFRGTSYIIDMKRFISTLEQIQQAAPSLFEEEKK